jgi:uncharacterized protein (TIGR02300 family)
MVAEERRDPMDAARKDKLGKKWTCFSCQAKFYDLNKEEPICPKCGADQRASPVVEKPARKRASPKAAPKAVLEPPPPSPEEELEILDMDEGIDLSEVDVDDLGED